MNCSMQCKYMYSVNTCTVEPLRGHNRNNLSTKLQNVFKFSKFKVFKCLLIILKSWTKFLAPMLLEVIYTCTCIL